MNALNINHNALFETIIDRPTQGDTWALNAVGQGGQVKDREEGHERVYYVIKRV